MTTAKPLPTDLPGLRELTGPESVWRTVACNTGKSNTPNCNKILNVGIFFDGTNNNKQRDQIDIADPLKKCHTNIVVLYDAYRDDPASGSFAFYVPGVGTPFPEIGELTETDAGKAFGKGGDARINWALIQLVNAIHRSAYGDVPLVEAKQAAHDATSLPLHDDFAFSANVGGKRSYFTDGCEADPKTRTPEVFPLLPKLRKALDRKKKPHMHLVNLSVFGFSRGAAQARAFCTVLDSIMDTDLTGLIAKWRGKENPGGSLAGVPLRVAFLGLFDTVASVGMADSSPWHGLGGWANGTMDVPARVERTVHFVAAHELRHAFPSSSVRIGSAYPKNCLEVVYPGAHSDVGGSYPSGSQGKALGGRSRLLSQVPLTAMYMEALKAGLPMRQESELRATAQGAATVEDLRVHPETARLFRSYAVWAAPKAEPVQEMLHKHARHYWHWRRQRRVNFSRLASLANANPQEKVDLTESEKDFREDDAKARKVLEEWQVRRGTLLASKTPAERDYLTDLSLPEVPPDVDQFFDTLVHDSHATFYMCGPTTDVDRRELVEKLRAKKATGATMNRLELSILSMNPAPDPGHVGTAAFPVQFPVIGDSDRDDLIAFNSFVVRNGLKAITKTRREAGGHLHYRNVFDGS